MNATITHTLEDGTTLRMCLMCQMRVTKDGKPDPQFYLLKWIEKFNARTDKKCDHKKPRLIRRIMENNQRVIGTLPLNIPNQRARVQKFVLDGDRVRVEIDQETSSLVDKLSADLTTQPFLSKILRDLELRGLRYDAELAAEGSAWEVAAEPEPQYFETLCEAIDFRDSLIDIEPRQK